MNRFLPRLGLLSLACLLSACQTFIDGDQQLYEQSGKVFEESLQQTAAKVTPPPAVQASLIPPLSSALGMGSGPRFDVAAKDMPAREFFLSLMEGAGQNLVVHPDVTGSITFSLRRVTLEEVLAAVRDSYGYDFRKTSYGYQILPNQAITRSYDLNYLNLQRQGLTDTEVSSGQITTSDTSDSDSDNGSDSGSSSTTSTRPASQLVTTSNADFWREVEAVVGMIVGTEKGNSVVINPQASLLVVRANSADQENVARFLEQAQRNLERQVILETKILEVDLSDEFQAGINWTNVTGNGSFGVGSFVTDAITGINTPVDPLDSGAFTGSFDFGDFSGVIQLLQTQGEVRVLSSPRISTLNNQKAVIKVGEDRFFVTDVSSGDSSSGGTIVDGEAIPPTPDITLTPFFSGISLDVTPQIDQNDTVTLHVRPTVSRVQKQEDDPFIVNGAEFDLPLAQSTTRQSDSIVRARSGQVVVIGGLMQNTNQNTDAEVPWASSLPFIGPLFKQQGKALKKSELVILMRPQVVSDEVWLNELRKSAETFQELR